MTYRDCWCIKLCILFLMVLNLKVRADEQVSAGAEVFKGYDIYATTIIKEDTVWKQWFAGWMNEADKPWDRMYYSISRDSGETWSQPVESFTIENVQVNDPSVIRIWDAEKARYFYRMYYTYYPSGMGDPTNYIAVSTSMDGMDWTHHGVLVGADNGIDNDGAWAPSAIASDSLASEVYLYFHNNHPDGRIFRATLSDVGLDFNSASTTTVTSAGRLRANPDVSRSPDGTWWMFYNGSSLTSDGKGNFNTCKMVSEDGMNWQESSHNPVQEYEEMTTTTPHVVWTDSSTYQLWYGYGTPSFLNFDVYLQNFHLEAEPERSVVASSEALEVMGASMAIDGNPATFWSSAGHVESGEHTEWIYLDLGESTEISRFELTPRIVEGAAMCFPVDFSFQTSPDALMWTDIEDQSYSDFQCEDTLTQVFRLENPASARYFRLLATELGPDSYGNYYCQIAEMKVSLDSSATGTALPGQYHRSPELNNYPNPFVNSTTISYTLPCSSHVRLTVFDLLGRKLEELVNERQSPGIHQVRWENPVIGMNTPGCKQYVISLQTEKQVISRKIIQL